MAITAQTQGPRTPYVLHKTQIRDHTGVEAIRLRCTDEDVPFSDDLSRDPIFCFQVYSTISLEEDEEDVPAAKCAKVGWAGRSGEVTNLSRLIRHIGADLPHDDRSPIFEIYAPQRDVFVSVEHQRREIAYRKAHKDEANTLLIPKVALGEYDRRCAGFLIVVTSDTYKTGSFVEGDADPDGPLWVWFDRRFPNATSVVPSSRLARDPSMTTKDIAVLPEKMEVLVRRMQQVLDMQSTLNMLYGYSAYPKEKPDYALSEAEGEPDMPVSKTFLHTLTRSAHARSLSGTSVESVNDTVIISSNGPSAEPSLRYTIYTPFLHQPGFESALEQTAKAFTAAFTSRIPAGSTVHFEFRKPPEPTMASVLLDHRAAMKTRPSNWTGVLFSATDQAPTGDANKGAIPPRIYPCTRKEDLSLDIGIERYKTFAAVLDRPDFVNEAGVLFLLADGGKFLPVPWDLGRLAFDFDEMHVWRAAGMDEVARRLSMIVP